MIPDTSSSYSIEAGLVAAAGASKVQESSKLLGSWGRIGPEVVTNVFVAPAVALGVGVGYQPAFYTGASKTAVRHDVSGRLVARYRLFCGSGIEHWLVTALQINFSMRGSTVEIAYSERYDQTIHRLSGFLGYRPSFWLSDTARLGIDVGVALGPSLGGVTDPDWAWSMEFSGRLGVEFLL
jgi:hypothetical protein